MFERVWLTTGVSGDRIVGTVRRLEAVADFTETYPE